MSEMLRAAAQDPEAIAQAVAGAGLTHRAVALAHEAKRVAAAVGGGPRYEDLYAFFDAVARAGQGSA